MKKERDYTNRTLVQTDEVLTVIADAREPMGLADVVRTTGLKQDAAFRILWNLERLGWLKEVGGKFAIDMKLALFWARYKSRREAERDSIDRELKELEVAEHGT